METEDSASYTNTAIKPFLAKKIGADIYTPNKPQGEATVHTQISSW